MTFLNKIKARIVDKLSGGVVKNIRKHLNNLLSEDREYTLKHLPTHMVEANRLEQFYQWLTDFDFIQEKIFAPEIPIQALIEDYNLALNSKSSFPSEQAEVLKLIQGALQLSAHVINEDKTQLAGQLLGRLLSFENLKLKKLLQQAQQSKNICLVPQTRSLTPPGGTLVRTLTGHSDSVYAVAITSDNKYAISASGDKTLKVWDWQTGEEIRTLTGHISWVSAVAITSDNKYAISASGDHTLIVWNWQTGEQLRTLTGHSGGVLAVAITSDNKYAISASRDNTLKVWDLQTGEQLRTLTGHSSWVNAVAITSDNKYAISASDDTTVKIWNWQIGEQLRNLTAHWNGNKAVALTSDNKYAISAFGETLKVWDLETGEQLRPLIVDPGQVNLVAISTGIGYSGNGYAISTWYGENLAFTLEVWDFTTREELRTLTGHSDSVNAVAITSDNKYAISASRDNTLKVWNWQIKEQVDTLTSHSSKVNAVAITSDNKYAISTCYDLTLKVYTPKVWDLETGKQLRTLPGHASAGGVAITSDNKYAISTCYDRTLKVWDVETGKKLPTLPGHSDPVEAVAISSDNKYTISASPGADLFDADLPGADLIVWDWQTGEQLRTLTGHSNSVNAVAIASDHKYAISASRDKTLKVWNWQTGEVIASFTGESEMLCCAVASDGVRIIAGEASGRIHFLQLKGVETSQKLKTHDQNNLLKYQDVGDDYEMAATYHQLGKTAHLEKRFEKAQVYYQKALRIYETAYDYESAADDYYNLGLIAKQQERFEAAISYFVKALNIFEDVYDTEKHGSTVRQLGKIYKILGEYLFLVTYHKVMGEKCPKELFFAIQTLSQAN